MTLFDESKANAVSDDADRRKLYFALLEELDDTTMLALKTLLAKDELSDLENYLAHVLNTILENNRALAYSITRNFNMIAGTCLRNLLENWANLASVLRSTDKKDAKATAITKTAFKYAEVLNRLVKKEITLEELQNLPSWAESNLSQRVRKLGDGAEFQYELLSRYTHTDMWAAINDQMVDKDRFWTSLLGWGLEFSMETLSLVDAERDLPPLRAKAANLNQRISKAFSGS